ncbi:hypothetical protein [Azospirillum brasilense]|uniref:hypothetical protein n=1 Tax=Azospirillum brasilense TaxID=192 RepID=UPI001EDA6428|nr:hypothetical protein [Azospirillum brasilense]UKJ75444.1 hypothetical protein H1Q64_14405 [Azospirillum brasilense]
MMLDQVTDKLDQLQAKLPQLAHALEQKRLGDALRRAIEATRNCEAQVAKLRALSKAGALVAAYAMEQHEALEEVVENVIYIGDILRAAQDSAALDEAVRDYQDLDKEVMRLQRAVRTMVERYATAELRPLAALGSLLSRIGQPQLGDQLVMLETTALAALRGSPLDLPTGIAAIQADATRLMNELHTLAKDDEVDAFLLALAKGQASLQLVTPSVLTWLGEQRALDKFRVLST